jgi:hypothetical protein
MTGTFKVLRDKNAKKPFNERAFETVEEADPIGPDKEVVFTGSSRECDEYVQKQLKPVKKDNAAPPKGYGQKK